MKKIITILAFASLFAGCVSTQTYSNYVEPKTKEFNRSENQDWDWLQIVTTQKEPVETRYIQHKKSFIPAVLYWSWNSTIECELDANTRLQLFRNSFYKAADSLGLEQLLEGKKLQLSLNNIPGSFLYENKGYTAIFLIAYTFAAQETITPISKISQNLEFDYLVLDAQVKPDTLETRTETYLRACPYNQQPIRNIWKSTKKFTWLYLDEYKKEVEGMTLDIVKSIIADLK